MAFWWPSDGPLFHPSNGKTIHFVHFWPTGWVPKSSESMTVKKQLVGVRHGEFFVIKSWTITIAGKSSRTDLPLPSWIAILGFHSLPRNHLFKAPVRWIIVPFPAFMAIEGRFTTASTRPSRTKSLVGREDTPKRFEAWNRDCTSWWQPKHRESKEGHALSLSNTFNIAGHDASHVGYKSGSDTDYSCLSVQGCDYCDWLGGSAMKLKNKLVSRILITSYHISHTKIY